MEVYSTKALTYRLPVFEEFEQVSEIRHSEKAFPNKLPTINTGLSC